MEKAIEVKNLSFSYEKDVPVLKNISFSVNKGEYVTLIGHNGSGKSTLSKLLCYLLEANSGTITVFEKVLNDENIKDIRKSIGIVFQNPDNQFIGSTVESDIAFGLENRNFSREEMRDLINKYSSLVGMNDFLRRAPDELSGGQKQRVAIAGILALGLKIIIFDEATSMLDPEGVEDIKKLIFEMKKEDKDLTFISITHDIEEAYLSDRVIILNKGEIFKEGNPFEVFKDENSIKEIGLDIPFVLKVVNSLKERGVIINENVRTFEELAKIICQ